MDYHVLNGHFGTLTGHIMQFQGFLDRKEEVSESLIIDIYQTSLEIFECSGRLVSMLAKTFGFSEESIKKIADKYSANIWMEHHEKSKKKKQYTIIKEDIATRGNIINSTEKKQKDQYTESKD
ncbi:hypothetical protein [Magnetofaba australis]|uniref:hypothetical protein n=1 Tax=Magnetofaba australis TaxID=1472297 RepID=UPI00117D066A|nr:hypothetical protein [Magnetofaba australis]